MIYDNIYDQLIVCVYNTYTCLDEEASTGACRGLTEAPGDWDVYGDRKGPPHPHFDKIVGRVRFEHARRYWAIEFYCTF